MGEVLRSLGHEVLDVGKGGALRAIGRQVSLVTETEGAGEAEFPA